MAYLLDITRAGHPSISQSVADQDLVIGQGSDADIVVGGDGIQAKQARLEVRNQMVLLYNLGLPGMVRVAGKPVRSTLLNVGDVVEVGDSHLVLRQDEGDAQSPSAVRRSVYRKLIERMNLRKISIDHLGDDELWERCEKTVDEILSEDALPSGIDAQLIKRDVLNEALGLGPLEDLLSDESVTEIMVNGPDNIFLERNGKIVQSPSTFTSNEQVTNVIQRIVADIGRRIDESSPLVDARLQDGSRVNAVIPPISLQGPMITIRKFSKKMYVIEDIIRFGTLTPVMGDFLRHAVESRQNIIISGGTGSGKTTLLNVISSFIPISERVVTIEDSAELRLPQKNLCSLEARPPNIEGKGEVTIRDLVRNALRMRPDRIVVGECRGGETIDMLQAMNTGHDGSLTTLHANTPSDALMRLETMVMMSKLDLPVSVVRRQIASGVNFVVQQARLSDGSRRVMSIVEVGDIVDGELEVRPVFEFARHGYGPEGQVLGTFRACGYVPEFIVEAERVGLSRLESFHQAVEDSKRLT